MKKIFLPIILFCLLAVLFVPILSSAAIVNCNGTKESPCDFDAFKQMLTDILDFLVKQIAAPLAIIGVSVGAVLMIISAGNPNMFGLGKKTLFASLIGLALAFGTSAIIQFILDAVQYNQGK